MHIALENIHLIFYYIPKVTHFSKSMMHFATGVHILAAGCIDFETCAPGVCMLFEFSIFI